MTTRAPAVLKKTPWEHGQTEWTHSLLSLFLPQVICANAGLQIVWGKIHAVSGGPHCYLLLHDQHPLPLRLILIIYSTRRPLIPYSIQQLANHHHDHPHRLPDLQMLWGGNSCRARRRQPFSTKLHHLLFLMIAYSPSYETLNTIVVLAFLITIHQGQC